MDGAFLVLLQIDTWEWRVRYAWRSMHWLVHLDITLLALMLVFTLVILCRSSFLHYLRTPSLGDRTFQRDLRASVGELSWGLGFVKSIGGTAPSLGVAGTCFSVLYAFRGIEGDRDSVTRILALDMAAALVTTAIGLAVGVIATLVDNHFHNRADALKQQISIADQTGGKLSTWTGQEQRRYQKFPLARRFSQLPAFPLLAAPSLALLLALFMPSHISKGFRVRLEGEPLSASLNSALQINIGVPERSTTGSTFVYVNGKKTQLDELDGVLRRELNNGANAMVYLRAENNVAWSDVVNAIDAATRLRIRVVLLTTPPDAKSNYAHKRSKPKS